MNTTIDKPNNQNRVVQSRSTTEDGINSLIWIRDEIRRAFSESEVCLSHQLDSVSDSDYSMLEASRKWLHQASGALIMLDLKGVTEMTSLIAGLLDRAQDGDIEVTADLVSTVGRAYNAIGEYLHELSNGSDQNPLWLYPYLRSVLALSGDDRDNPSDLLLIDDDGIARIRLNDLVPTETSTEDRAAARSNFESGLLRLLRNPTDSDALKKMQNAVEIVSTLSQERGDRVCWYVVAAWLRGVDQQCIALDAVGKRLLARVNFDLRQSLNGQSGDLTVLLRDALFCVACADPISDELEILFDAFGLHGQVTDGYAVPRYGLMDQRAILGGTEAVAAMKKSWEAMLQQSGGIEAYIGDFKNSLSSFQDVTEALGEPGLDRIIGAWIGVVKTMGLDSGPVSDALGVEVAVSLLFVEQLFQGGFKELKDLDVRCAEVGRRIDSALHDIDVSSETPAWLCELSASVQERLTMSAFIAETRVSLREAELAIDSWARDNNETDGLKTAVKNFSDISGVMALLDFSEATRAARHIATLIETITSDSGSVDILGQDSLADSIGTLGFFVDGLSGPVDRLQNYRFCETTGEFRYEAGYFDRINGADPKVDSEAAFRADSGQFNSDELQDSIDCPEPDALSNFDETAAVDVVDASGMLPESSEPPAPEVSAELSGVDPELLDIFLAEAGEVLEHLTSERNTLAIDGDDHTALTNVRRAFHTLKGSSRMVGLAAFGDASLAFEDLLNRWLAASVGATPELLDLINRACGEFEAWVAALSNGRCSDTDIDCLVKAAQQMRPGEAVQSANESVADSATEEITVSEFSANVETIVLDGLLQTDATDDQSQLDELFAEADSKPDSSEYRSETIGNAVDGVDDSVPDFDSIDLNLTGFEAEPSEDESRNQSADASEEKSVQIGDRSISKALFDVFNTEVDQLRSELVTDASEWHKNPSRVASEVALRGLHSLKGSAGLVGAEPGRVMADHLEEFLIAQGATGRVASLAEVTEYGRLLQVLFTSLREFTREQVPNSRAEDIEAARQLALNWQGAPTVPGSDGSAAVKSVPSVSATAPVDVVDEFDAELLPLFIAEAEELLPRIDKSLRAWQSDPNSLELKQVVMRDLHTVKGSARMAGAMILGQRVHEMETRVELAISSAENPAGLVEELILEQDYVSDQFSKLCGDSGKSHAVTGKGALNKAQPESGVAPSSVAVSGSGETHPTAAATSLGGAASASGPLSGSSLVRVRAEVIEKMVNEAGEVSITRSRLDNSVGELRLVLSELGENVNRLRAQLRELEIQADGKIQSNDANHSAEGFGAEKSDFDVLEFDRYTRFQELTRMLAESVSDVATVQQNATRYLDDANQDLSRQSTSMRQLQYHLMSIRMVQFGSISDRLYRVVRQSAKALDKRVSLDILGSDSEVDRNILETMVAPLEHLLRNAISHGIESPDARAAAKKPEKGELRLSIFHDGNEIVLTLSDDGAGLNYDAIRSRGISSGLITEDESLSDPELANLIFRPGFSTAQTIDQISGRGVGMDVVRAEVLGLGGRIGLTSEKGLGTQFTIHLPLTMAISQVMMARVGDTSFAVLAAGVEKVLQLNPEDLSAAYTERFIEWGNAKVPLYYLASLVDMADHQPVAQPFSPVMILRSAGHRIAVHADSVSKSQEVVVKNAGPQVARVAGVAGATVMGNGEVVLIVNPGQLAENVSDTIQDAAMQAGMVARLSDAPSVVMVVDDSVTVRKVTQRLLVREGFEVMLAKDGVDALRQLQDQQPDIMLVDVEMPRMDGFDLTRALREDTRYVGIPVVMITSRTADKHRNHAFSLGVNEFLGKPYIESDLLPLIRSYVEKSKRDNDNDNDNGDALH
ncbi:MAG: Hpt domain-containing protein [Burkholderiaceae bacterium]